jgi:EAL and modified HD-GYP domain-containing signal transduction protein
MSASVLGSVTLGYEPIWNQWRRSAGVRLLVESAAHAAVDARHLLDAIAELWPQSPPSQPSARALLLSVKPTSLLNGLLEHPPVPGVWIEIQQAWLSDTIFAGRIRQAHQRGVSMVWRGEPGQAPTQDAQSWFHKTMLSLSPSDALQALRLSLRQHQPGGDGAHGHGPSPVVAGSLYEGLASPALVEHALDRQSAWGVVGWPAEEVLHAYRFKQIQPARQVISALLKAIDADASMEALESAMGQDPLLTYRFLRYANSASMGLGRDVGSVRQGLMALGYSKLRGWLMAQLPHANSDTNLDPVRASMVLRARIMERLADAGVEDDLRREVFLCGIFSQMDLLLGEPLGAAIHQLPLPGRVASAVVGQSGPYAPWLEVASALESANTRVIREVCKAHKVDTAEVNRALLRALATSV